ncbi:MAG: PH domain-containing protein, partial [Kurthia sp.]
KYPIRGLFSKCLSDRVHFIIYWMAFSITYELREDYLYVRAGFLFTKVRYEHIESYRELSGFMDVFTGFNLLSSTDGLAIMSQKIVLGEVKISPVEKERFIQELEKKMVKREV